MLIKINEIEMFFYLFCFFLCLINKGIMSDVFPEKKRALVMAIFNWGIYGGYGIAFPVGRYVSKLNIWDLVCILIQTLSLTFFF